MLKSFRENVGSLEDVYKEIDRVVDVWVNELLKSMTSSPMDPSTKRSLWDRFKGTLSNIWYGGRYNPQNPYYWKHRFGDELGATSESQSFNPSVFSLQEYHKLKYIIEEFENNININEQEIPPGAEKLKIVQIIKSEAEKLKKELKNIFAAKFSSPAPDVSVPAPQKDADAASSTDGEDVAEQPKRKVGRPRKKPVSSEERLPLPPSYEVGSEEKYKEALPKAENIGKSLEFLKKEKQRVDVILHPDYGIKDFYDPDNDHSVESAADIKIKFLEKLKNDAIKHNEESGVVDDIIKAIEKMKRFSS